MCKKKFQEPLNVCKSRCKPLQRCYSTRKNRAFGLVTWQIATPKAVATEETGRSQAEG